MTIRYTGTDRRGTAHTGRTDVVSLAAFVRRRYQAGWQSLSVYRDSNASDATGGIMRNPDSGRRVMWVEK